MSSGEANVRINVTGNAASKLDDLRAKAKALGVEFDKQGRARVGNRWISQAELAAIVAAGKHVKELGKAAKTASENVEKIGDGFTGAAAAAKALGSAVVAANDGFEKLNSKLDKSFGSLPFLRNFTNVTGMIEGAASALAAAAAVGVGAFATGIVYAVREASELETAMSRVRAATAGSRSEMSALTAAASQLGAATQYSAAEVAAVQENFAKAGFSVSQILKATPSTLGFASATGTDTGFASGLLASTIRSMGFQAGDSRMVADSLAVGAQASNVDVTDLGEAMKYAAPIFRSMGRGQQRTTAFQDMVALSGILGDQGIRGSQAGTALRAGYTRISSDRGAQRELSRLRISPTGADGNIRRMPEILADLRTAMEGKSTGEQSASMNRIFGLNSASAFSAILGADESRFSELVAQLDASGGAAERTARIMQDNLAGDLEQLGGAMGGLGTTIGNQLLPDTRTAVGSITDFVGAVNAAFGAAAGGKGPFENLGDAIGTATDAVISVLVDVVPKIAGAMEQLGLIEEGESARISGNLAAGLVHAREERVGLMGQRERDQIDQEERGRRLGLATIRGSLMSAQGENGTNLAASIRERLAEKGLEDFASRPEIATQLAAIESTQGPISVRQQRQLVGGVSGAIAPLIEPETQRNREEAAARRAQVTSAEERARAAIQATYAQTVAEARGDAVSGQNVGMALDALGRSTMDMIPGGAGLYGLVRGAGGGAPRSTEQSGDERSVEALRQLASILTDIRTNTSRPGDTGDTSAAGR